MRGRRSSSTRANAPRRARRPRGRRAERSPATRRTSRWHALGGLRRGLGGVDMALLLAPTEREMAEAPAGPRSVARDASPARGATAARGVWMPAAPQTDSGDFGTSSAASDPGDSPQRPDRRREVRHGALARVCLTTSRPASARLLKAAADHPLAGAFAATEHSSRRPALRSMSPPITRARVERIVRSRMGVVGFVLSHEQLPAELVTRDCREAAGFDRCGRATFPIPGWTTRATAARRGSRRNSQHVSGPVSGTGVHVHVAINRHRSQAFERCRGSLQVACSWAWAGRGDQRAHDEARGASTRSARSGSSKPSKSFAAWTAMDVAGTDAITTGRGALYNPPAV